MPHPPVHWAEGMFLGPQHLQSADRSLRDLVRTAEDWTIGYSYGLRAIEIDRDALTNRRVVLPRCHARLRDGTHLRYPEDATLPPAVVPDDAFRSPSDRPMVYLAVPRLELGRANAAMAESESTTRFLVEATETEDENQAGSPHVVEYRRLNARIIVGEAGLTGFETLPLFRLKLAETAEAAPEVDPDYIPPILACDAWSPLRDQFLSGIRDHLGSQSEKLARQMIDRGVAFESGHREDLERILMLHAVNGALATVWNLPGSRGVHPFAAYRDLCAAAGHLAVFRSQRRLPDLPRYNHDDLASTFFPLRAMFSVVEGQDYVKRPFIGDGQRLRVLIEEDWLGSKWAFYVGVESELSDPAVDRLLMTELDLKIASSNEVNAIFRDALQGIPLILENQPPRDFPRATGSRRWCYWRVDRRSFRWEVVEKKTRDLGIRFNQAQVEGQLAGEAPVRIRQPDGRLIELSFALFAISAAPA